jgi:ComEC/Rec2-related protein
VALAALSGVVLGGVLPVGPIGPALAAALLASGALARRSIGLLLAAVFLLGLARRLDARASEPVIVEEDAPALLKGHVLEEPVPRPGGAVELVFEVEEGWTGDGAWGGWEDAHGPADPAPPGLRVHARFTREARKRAGDLLPGRRLELAGTLRAPRAPRVTSDFDPRDELVREGAAAFLDVHESWRLDGRALGVAGLVARAGRRARAAIRAARLERDEEAVLRAVVLGDRGGFAPETLKAFRKTAMVHAITVSGLHVAVLAWLLALLARVLPLKLRGLAVALGLALYLGLAGPHPGVLRAAIAGALLAVAQGWGRGGDAWNRLGVALLAVLAWDPLSVEESGFQLTFGTVAGLLALGPVFREALGGGRLRRALATSLAAFCAHAPLLVARFGQVAPVAIVANLPALPLTMATLVLGLSGTALGMLSPALGAPVLVAAGFFARLLLALVALAAELPPLALHRPSPLTTAVAVGLAVIGFALRRRLLLGAGLLLLAAAVLPSRGAVDEPSRVHFLPGETRIDGPFEELAADVYRVESAGESVLILDDPGGRDLARVLATVPEGKLRASVLVARGHPSVALARLVERTRPLVLLASRPIARAYPGALTEGWTVEVGAPLSLDRYHSRE